MKTMRSTLLLLALAAFTIASPSAPTNYDFFLLVLQYAPALCGSQFKCPSPATWTYFTLHGLWPERSDGTYPQTCSNQKFDPSAVQSIQPQLEKYWISLNGPSETFWSHGPLEVQAAASLSFIWCGVALPFLTPRSPPPLPSTRVRKAWHLRNRRVSQ